MLAYTLVSRIVQHHLVFFCLSTPHQRQLRISNADVSLSQSTSFMFAYPSVSQSVSYHLHITFSIPFLNETDSLIGNAGAPQNSFANVCMHTRVTIYRTPPPPPLPLRPRVKMITRNQKGRWNAGMWRQNFAGVCTNCTTPPPPPQPFRAKTRTTTHRECLYAEKELRRCLHTHPCCRTPPPPPLPFCPPT